MKKKIGVFACLLLLCLIVPGASFALNSNVEFSLSKGSGDFSVPGVPATADVDSLELQLDFYYYFQGLETDDTPYGAREFLQHPSFIGGGFLKYEVEIVGNTGNTLDYNVDGIGFGGMFYTSRESNATGIGLTYASVDTETITTIGGTPTTTDMDEADIVLSLRRYLADGVRLELDYTMADIDRGTVSADGTLIRIGASALIDSIWLSGYFVDGEEDWPAGYTDDDISGLGFTLGTYISQSTGLFFEYTSQEIDDGSSTIDVTNISFTADHYFNESAHIKGTLTLHEEDDPTFAEIEETIITLAGGFFF